MYTLAGFDLTTQWLETVPIRVTGYVCENIAHFSPE
jgi:hypothetical protein